METFQFSGTGNGRAIISAARSTVKNSPPLVLLVGGAVALVLLSFLYDSVRRKQSNLPPGPLNWPFIGAMLEMESKIYLATARLARKYGPILYFRLGIQPVVVVSSAEVAEEMLKHKDALIANRSALMSKTVVKYLGFESGVIIWSDYVPDHIQSRKALMTEFFTIAKLRTYEELRSEEIAFMVEKILSNIERTGKSNELQNGQRSVTIGVREMFSATSLNIMFALVMGKRFDSLSPTNHLREFPRILQEFERLVTTFNVVDVLPFLAWFDPQGLLRDFKAFEQKHTEFYEKIIADRRRLRETVKLGGNMVTDGDVTERNFVDVLLNFQEEGAQIGDKYVIGTLLGSLVAGIDTVSSTLEWTMLELLRHPELLKRLQAEVDGVVGMDRPVDETDIQLQNMPFLNAVIMEAGRLHPVVAVSFPHTNKVATTLAGYTIPANTAVLLNIRYINRDPRFWKDPLEFNPERFMGPEGGKIKANGTHFSLLTFGGGRRGCPGYNLAWVLLLRGIATLVHAFDWSPPPGLSSKDLSTEESSGAALLSPKVKLVLTATRRISSSVYHSKIVI